jgi:hypothetical protein
LFYAVVQSACYTLCFHGVELAVLHRNDAKVRSNWELVVSSTFDPLRFCLKTVRVEFVRLAAHTGLFSNSCWDTIPADLLYTEVLQQQQYQMTAESTTQFRATTDNSTLATFTTHELAAKRGYYVQASSQKETYSANSLDSFFPFDPCLLCNMHQAVAQSYRIWEGVPGLDGDEDDEDDEDAYEDDDGEYDEDEDSLDASSEAKRQLAPASGIRSIPMPKSNKHVGAHGSGMMMASSATSSHADAFATSSMSSVVSSMAGTDNAAAASYMSIASSLNNTANNNSGYLQANTSMGSSSGLGSAMGIGIGQNYGGGDRTKDDDDDDDDDDVHESHMVLPSSYSSGSGSAAINAGAGLMANGMAGGGFANASANAAALHEKFESNFRRPRFYSIGSTGSW